MNQFNSSNKDVLMIVLAVAITALIVGGGVFLWQRSTINELKSVITEEQQSSRQQIGSLQKQLSTLQSGTSNQNFTTPTPSEPFTYTKNDQLFSVSKKEFNVLDQFNFSTLKDQSQECGTNKTEQYFKNLLSKYTSGDKGIEYDFQYKGQTQDSGILVVTVIPNKLGYVNVDDFKKDFDICAAGADKYPSLVSEKYLLFISSCGTGFDDGSGKPHGCDKVGEAVESTIKLQ